MHNVAKPILKLQLLFLLAWRLPSVVFAHPSGKGRECFLISNTVLWSEGHIESCIMFSRTLLRIPESERSKPRSQWSSRKYFKPLVVNILNSDEGAWHRGGIMITYCCEKKIAGVLPTATGPAKHLFRQIEKKKLEQLMIEYAEYFPTCNNSCLL